MQVTEVANDGLKRAYTVVVPAGDIAAERQKRLTELGRDLRLPGFRPGKVPPKVVAQRYGQAVMGEVLEQSVNKATDQVVTDRGLRPALEALATRAPLPVELADVPEQPLPAPIEAAAYYVVAEALTNVAKYANAKHATVRIMRADGQARIEVSDDGVGGADPLGGTGLRGLADRIEALDGTLAVESNGSGTRVSAVIPCE